MGARVRSGLDVVLSKPPESLRGARVGLACHPASVTSGLTHAADALAAHPAFDLRALFGPQHGARGEKQDNMVESEDYQDPRLGLPVHSLYGATRRPTEAMLHGLDAVLLDLQDVGVRVYTFAWTMALAMEACGERGIRFVVLDRPNPIGGLREGPLLDEGFESFVGLHPVPLRHGLTMGEIARWLVASGRVRCDLEVVPCEGWDRATWQDGTGLPWVLPSPNLPTLESCAVYPGTVLLEGTTVSEGRGTTRPFELVGAPWLDGHALAGALEAHGLPGVRFRACAFEPTFQKHAGQRCGGVQLHVTDREVFRPVHATVALLREMKAQAPGIPLWREPPYEYETVKLPIDILWGSERLRRGVDALEAPEDIVARAQAGVAAFASGLGPVLLY